jgi:hypothetical protein
MTDDVDYEWVERLTTQPLAIEKETQRQELKSIPESWGSSLNEVLDDISLSYNSYEYPMMRMPMGINAYWGSKALRL